MMSGNEVDSIKSRIMGISGLEQGIKTETVAILNDPMKVRQLLKHIESHIHKLSNEVDGKEKLQPFIELRDNLRRIFQ